MSHTSRVLALVLLTTMAPPAARATNTNAADNSIELFLSRDDGQPAYRATRHIEAQNGDRVGWIDAVTEYSPATGFRYEITAEGGSSYIRSKVLRPVLDGEREVIAQGEADRSALARENYTFEANGVDENGLANVLLKPRRKERVLVSGTLFLQPHEGEPRRLEGRLAKSPSFWIKNVDIVRTYDRVGGVVVPVGLESNAQLRMFGTGSLRITYVYTEINGRPVPPAN